MDDGPFRTFRTRQDGSGSTLWPWCLGSSGFEPLFNEIHIIAYEHYLFICGI